MTCIVFQLKRKITKRSALRTRYQFRLVDSKDRTIFSGENQNGYLTSQIEYRNAEGEICGTFGPGSRIAARAIT